MSESKNQRTEKSVITLQWLNKRMGVLNELASTDYKVRKTKYGYDVTSPTLFGTVVSMTGKKMAYFINGALFITRRDTKESVERAIEYNQLRQAGISPNDTVAALKKDEKEAEKLPDRADKKDPQPGDSAVVLTGGGPRLAVVEKLCLRGVRLVGWVDPVLPRHVIATKTPEAEMHYQGLVYAASQLRLLGEQLKGLIERGQDFQTVLTEIKGFVSALDGPL